MKETRMSKNPSGLRKGLTSYGDPGFPLFLRKAFIKAKGFSNDALDRPIIGVTDTYSDFNPCHGNVPQLATGNECLLPCQWIGCPASMSYVRPRTRSNRLRRSYCRSALEKRILANVNGMIESNPCP